VQLIPDHLVDLVTTDNVAHVTLREADGSLVTHVLWIDYDGRQLMIWSRTNSHKSRVFRARPQVAVSVVDRQNPWRRLSISGRVTEFRPDIGHEFINKLAWRYTNTPYPRAPESEIIVITPDRVRAFNDRFSSPLEVATV
jgi:hypothetical protein